MLWNWVWGFYWTWNQNALEIKVVVGVVWQELDRGVSIPAWNEVTLHGPGSSVCIATGCRLDGLVIESQWGARFYAHVRPTRPYVQLEPELSRG
jgi:hypothetical protein